MSFKAPLYPFTETTTFKLLLTPVLILVSVLTDDAVPNGSDGWHLSVKYY